MNSPQWKDPSKGRRPTPGPITERLDEELPSLNEVVDVLEYRHPGLKQEIMQAQGYKVSASVHKPK
jgi:hypothetical protein